MIKTKNVDIFLGLYDINSDGKYEFICFVNSPLVKDAAINEQNIISEEILNRKKENSQIRTN